MPSLRHSSAMLSSPRRPSSTMRILSSAEKWRRVCRRMSFAQLVLSDVPYNLSGKTISGSGKIKHGDFIQGAGEMSRAEFTRFLTSAMRCMRGASIDGSIHMIFMSWHYLLEMLRAGAIVYDELKAICTWIKQQGGQGAFYRSQTEFIAVFKNGDEKHINNIMMGRFGRNRTNAWNYAGMRNATTTTIYFTRPSIIGIGFWLSSYRPKGAEIPCRGCSRTHVTS